MKLKYLEILQLSEGATKDEIKKSFRRLALQYHPDKNPSQRAQAKFVEICDAYQRLNENDFNDIAPNDTATASDFRRRYNRNLTPEELEERIQKAKEYLKYKTAVEENIRSISYQEFRGSYMRHFSAIMCVISFIILMMLSTDFLILKPIEKDGVLLNVAQKGFEMNYLIYDLEGVGKLSNRGANEDLYFSLTSLISNEDWRYIPLNYRVKVFETPLLGDILGFVEADADQKPMIVHQYRFHFMFWGYFILFLSPLVTLFFRGPNSFYIIFVYLTTYLTAITTIFFCFNIITYFA